MICFLHRDRTGRCWHHPAHAVLVATAVVAILTAASRGDEMTAKPDKVCGPRCVRYVLATYGVRASLPELILEIQRNELHHPADLASMERALRKRGVYATAFRIEPSDLGRVDWPGPIIVHRLSAREPEGHFVVARPDLAEHGRLPVWDGINGESPLPEAALSDGASGVALLTSDHEISTPLACPLRQSGAAQWRAAGFAALALTLLSGSWYWRFRAQGT